MNGASDLLNALGGITSVEKSGKAYRIVGRACPLSRAVEADHCVCAAVTTLVAEVVGAEVVLVSADFLSDPHAPATSARTESAATARMVLCFMMSP